MSRKGSYSRPALDEDKVFDDLNSSRWINLIFHLVRLAVAIICFGICAWVRFDLDFKVWVPALPWYTYWYCMYVIWVACSFEMLVSVLGVLGVLKDGRGKLLFCMIMMGILLFLNFTGGVVIILWGMEESPILAKELHEVFIHLIHVVEYDFQAQKVHKQIMEYVGCCGADGSENYINMLKPLPTECRDEITGVEYVYGCSQQFAWWLEPWTASLAAMAFFLGVTDIFGIFSNNRLRRHIHQFRMITDGQ